MSELQTVQDAKGNKNGPRVNTNKMGLFGAISYIIGNIVGSGIFIAPTSILLKAETVGLSLVIWAAAAAISIMGCFCYVELGTSIRQSGADFTYLCYVKWYSVAFAFMCIGCILNYPSTIAVQAHTFSEYIIKGFKIEIVGDVENFIAKKLISFSLIWLIMFINFFSLKTFVSRFQIAASLAKIISTAIIICTGFYFLIFKGETENISDPFHGTKFRIGAVVSALFAGLFSYDGWDVLNFGAEEIEKPKRTMPLAVILGMTAVAVIYLAINVAYFVVLDVEQIKNSEAVASTFAAVKLGNFQYAIPFLICILLIGSINSSVFSASRYLHAAARQGHTPTFISCINHDSDSPRAALFINILLSMAMSFAGDLDTLINYVGFTQWSQRACTMLALIWIRYRKFPVHKDAIQMPIILPIFFFLICAVLVVVTIVDSINISGVGMGVLAGGFVVYFLFLYEKSLPALKSFQRYTFYINNATTIFAQIVFNAMPERLEVSEAMIDEDMAGKADQLPVFTVTTDDDKIQKYETKKSKKIFRKRNKVTANVRNAPAPPKYEESPAL